jgi:hypothetical protein
MKKNSCLTFLVIFALGGVGMIWFALLFSSPQRGGRRGWVQHGPGAELRISNRMPEASAAEFTSNLPIVVLDTDGQRISKRDTTVVHARFFEPQNGRASVSGRPGYDGLAGIHLRGYSTLHLPKSSYTLHTLDRQTNQTKVALLGLPAEEDWVLYAPFEDKTLMRDVLAYELANRMGHYAPRTRFVELFVRASEHALSMKDYVGVYVLMEKIKRGKDRVHIAKLGPDDRSEPEITGGYIVKRDHSEQGGAKFRTQHGGPYLYVYPKPAQITSEQKRWLRDYFNRFESALYGPNLPTRSPATRPTWTKLRSSMPTGSLS